MLKLININQIYKYGKQSHHVLKNINLNFKSHELVFILGPSGSGKSTLLNIIGCLTKPSSGNIYLNNECLNRYSQDNLAKFRNHHFGFIFQHYHLINHMTILDNLKICQNKPNLEHINLILKQLNIFHKKHTKVSLLSGGEKQRVAIARALINNPQIILCDEPTGALDQKNAIQVMEILKSISKSKLVIVVSHDISLAKKYANRIINIQDGEVNTPPVIDEPCNVKLTKSKINKSTIFKLALKNLLQTKRRTFLTSFAISIGITAISLIAFLSTGFQQEITTLEENLVTNFPITIQETIYTLQSPKPSSNSHVFVKTDNENYHTNKITTNYLTYLSNNPNYHSQLYHYNINIPVITDNYQELSSNHLKAFPSQEYLKNNYQLIAGNFPENDYEVVLQIDSYYQISKSLATGFNLPDKFAFSELIGRIIKIPTNDEYFLMKNNYFYPNQDLEKVYHTSSFELTIVGLVQEKEIIDNESYLLYSPTINKQLLTKNQNSQIVNSQLKTNTNLINIQLSKEELLSYLGYQTLPYRIDIYFNNLKSKEIYTKYLSQYLDTKIIYEDPMKDTINIIKDFINIISLVLIIFSIIAIFVSSIMTSILTNTRIMERVKEIGILRSLGATSKNIKLLFNLENFFLALFSSIISLLINILISNPINQVINNYLEITNMYQIDYLIFIIITVVNLIIVILSGLIPVTKASKLNIIECLRQN